MSEIIHRIGIVSNHGDHLLGENHFRTVEEQAVDEIVYVGPISTLDAKSHRELIERQKRGVRWVAPENEASPVDAIQIDVGDTRIRYAPATGKPSPFPVDGASISRYFVDAPRVQLFGCWLGFSHWRMDEVTGKAEIVDELDEKPKSGICLDAAGKHIIFLPSIRSHAVSVLDVGERQLWIYRD